jgi:hypothetical protein
VYSPPPHVVLRRERRRLLPRHRAVRRQVALVAHQRDDDPGARALLQLRRVEHAQVPVLPARMSKRVILPHPLGGIIATSDPGVMTPSTGRGWRIVRVVVEVAAVLVAPSAFEQRSSDSIPLIGVGCRAC